MTYGTEIEAARRKAIKSVIGSGCKKGNWTANEVSQLKTLFLIGRTQREIAEALDRTVDGVYRQLCNHFSTEERLKVRVNRGFRAYRTFNVVRPTKYSDAPQKISPDLIEDRDSRANEPLSLAQRLCGDPVPSRSALTFQTKPQRVAESGGRSMRITLPAACGEFAFFVPPPLEDDHVETMETANV